MVTWGLDGLRKFPQPMLITPCTCPRKFHSACASTTDPNYSLLLSCDVVEAEHDLPAQTQRRRIRRKQANVLRVRACASTTGLARRVYPITVWNSSVPQDRHTLRTGAPDDINTDHPPARADTADLDAVMGEEHSCIDRCRHAATCTCPQHRKPMNPVKRHHARELEFQRPSGQGKRPPRTHEPRNVNRHTVMETARYDRRPVSFLADTPCVQEAATP